MEIWYFDYVFQYYKIQKIRKNIEKIDEIEEWKEIILNGTNVKVSVSHELLESIKKLIPDEINEN